MSDHGDLPADQGQEDLFEREIRGYSRRRVDEFVARHRSDLRKLQDQLAERELGSEQLQQELAAARQELADKPAHEEISERVGQILRLADEEAKSQRDHALDDIAKLRDEATRDTEKLRGDTRQETEHALAQAREQAERMLTAAREQAERSVATARAEAEKLRAATLAETERVATEASQHAESSVAAAKAQAKQQLDEATARATAIHDGAERRLSLLTSRHTEAIRRLTEIRDVVTALVAGESSRGSLDDEVSKAVAGALGQQPAARQADPAASPPSAGPGGPDGRHSAATLRIGGTATAGRAAGAPSGPPAAAQPAGGRPEQEPATAVDARAEARRGAGRSANGNGHQPGAPG